eukprot:jgi/Botrbrau1/11295/Bobra.0038s0061.1
MALWVLGGVIALLVIALIVAGLIIGGGFVIFAVLVIIGMLASGAFFIIIAGLAIAGVAILGVGGAILTWLVAIAICLVIALTCLLYIGCPLASAFGKWLWSWACLFWNFFKEVLYPAPAPWHMYVRIHLQ